MSCIIHKWNGCRCEKCQKTRDTGHDWNGCKCRKCGKTRDEEHDYIYRCIEKPIAGQPGENKNWCERECRICGNRTRLEHDFQPTEIPCQSRCAQCGYTVSAHDFQPVPGRCAEICSVCGEEIDYLEIALNESEPADRRAAAVDKLKEASQMPKSLKKDCEKGKHVWRISRINPQQFQGGASSTEYTCAVCGKKEVQTDWGG